VNNSEEMDATSYGPLSAWTLGLGALSPVALMSSTWLGPVLGVIAIALGVLALRKSMTVTEKSMVTMGMAFGIMGVVLLWIAPGVNTILWG